MIGAVADNQNKWVAVLNRKVPTPQLMNALGHLALTMQSVCPDDTAKRVHRYDGADDTIYATLSHWPVIVLKADNGNHLRTLHQIATAAGIPCQAFVSTMLAGSAEAQLTQTETARHDTIEFMAVFLFGPNETLHRLTKKFSLFANVPANMAGSLAGMTDPDGAHFSGTGQEQKEIAIGIEQAERGEMIVFDEETAERIKAEASRRFGILRSR